jgi:excinuclease ABC subunit C
MTIEQFKKRMQKIPDAPGVYFFLGSRKEILYIGKAASLRDRVRSYFAPDIAAVRSPLIARMVEKAKTIDWRETDSVLEALILEANLIRTHKPKHNTDLKDDKTFNYVVITKEDFPRVLIVRGKQLEQKNYFRRSRAPVHLSGEKTFSVPAYTFGPFPHGAQLTEAMRIIRKIFPYRDTCIPAPDMIARGKKPKKCFNAQVGLCPGVCSGAISKGEYRKIIRRITLLFSGKKKELLRGLARDMQALAKKEKFEEAAQLRTQVFALQHIQDVSLIKNEYRAPNGTGGNNRIEAYDVAHLRGSAAVGVMTVVEQGIAQKQDYRKFNIRFAKGGDDAGALREILSRRLAHEDWPLPRLIVVDGSTAQINAAHSILAEYGFKIPVVGVVKDEKHRPRELRGDKTIIKDYEKDILLANAEAHRFAIGFHRNTSRKNLIARTQ